MSNKRKAPQDWRADKFKTVKRVKGTKVVVHTEILARIDGHVIADNALPEGLKCLIICKIANLELEIETMIDNYLKRRQSWLK
jgi:hypothetical protein